MKVPLSIRFHGMDPSDAVEAKVRQRAEELDQFSPILIRCEVWIDAPHRHHRKGDLFSVRVRLTTHGDEIDVGRQRPQHDVFVAIREALDAARRQLEDYQRRYRGDIKLHAAPPKGHVTRLFPAEEYGFLRTDDGREVFFHRNAVRDGENLDLEVGTEVEFTEEEGEKGPQAASVRIRRVPARA